MNLDRPVVVRGLVAAAALVFVVALIGAFTVDSGGDTKLSSSSGSTSTTATPGSLPSATPTVATTAAPTAAAARGSTATTKAAPSGPPPTASANVPDPGPTRPPAPGTYEYATVTNGSSSTTTEKYESQPDQNGAARRTHTYTDEQGNTISSTETWATDAVRVLNSHIVSAQGTVDCTWEPPILLVALPLSSGKTWNVDSMCKTSVNGAPVTIHVTGTAKVSAKSLDKVGSTSVATWVIDTNQTMDITTPFGPQHIVTTTTEHFAPSKGVVTYEKGSSTANGQTYNAERTLQNLTPK